MRFLIVVLVGFLSFQANAFEVICFGDDHELVVFKVFKSEAGTLLMSVNTDAGKFEGPVTVSENEDKKQIVYKLEDFTLVRKGSNFRMLDSDRICGLLVPSR